MIRHITRCRRRAHGGQALIYALAFCLGILMLIAAIAMQCSQQLRESKTVRREERALLMAEAGANAYLNVLSSGGPGPNDTSPNAAALPAINQLNANYSAYEWPLSLRDFRNHALAGDLKANTQRFTYPDGTTSQGYFVGHMGPLGTDVTIYSYGFADDVVRRVKVTAHAWSLFDWAGVAGLDTNKTSKALILLNGANVVGPVDAEGFAAWSGDSTFYDGPVIWANSSFDVPFRNPDPSSVPQSTVNNPPGHQGTGVLASPAMRHYARKLGWMTADQVANGDSGATSGVYYYANKAHNNDNTGIAIIVKGPGGYRELDPPFSPDLVPVTGPNAYALNLPDNAYCKKQGMKNNESFAALRFYPGDYYFTQISMAPGQVPFYLRTYNDDDMLGGDAAALKLPRVKNPSPGQAANKNIRFWIGRVASGTDPASTLTTEITLEDRTYASRFRVFDSSAGLLTITRRVGNGKDNNATPIPFYGQILHYNGTPPGNYGDIVVNNGCYVRGALIGWSVTLNKATVEHTTSEQSMEAVVAYDIVPRPWNPGWTELP